MVSGLAPIAAAQRGVAALALHTRFSHHVADVSIASASERTNLDVVKAIRALLDELVLSGGIGRRDGLVTFVADPPGHDLRYGIDPTRISTELGWQPRETFEAGLRKTVEWYLVNRSWWQRIRSGVYRGERLGVPA
jgi:dTDP-glucose 4,6-dehydratase